MDDESDLRLSRDESGFVSITEEPLFVSAMGKKNVK
jgi:hypothetical protein